MGAISTACIPILLGWTQDLKKFTSTDRGEQAPPPTPNNKKGRLGMTLQDLIQHKTHTYTHTHTHT